VARDTQWKVREGWEVMRETRRWVVEAKEFEVSIKGGLLGVRIVENRNNRRRSIFVHKDEISWLVGALGVAAKVDTSEVFWDQSRAGYIRLTTQRCANKHGRFLIIEEYDGRRRRGSIFVPEGRTGQGWVRMISEMKRACSLMKMGRENREVKPVKVQFGSRSFAEVVRTSRTMEEKGLHADTDSFAGVGLSVQGDLANEYPGRESAPSKTQIMPELQLSPEGDTQKSQGLSHVLVHAGEAQRVSGTSALLQIIGDDNLRGSKGGEECKGRKSQLKGRAVHPFNASQELKNIREWLKQVRGEVDAGLERVEGVINMLENDGPGQVKKKTVWMPKPNRKFWHKRKRINFKRADVGLGPGPSEAVVLLKHMDGAGSHVDMGLSRGLNPKPMQMSPSGEGKKTGLGPE
jgi:hypothetical protein